MIDYGERNIVPLADIIFYQGEEREMTIHCLCSRAYVKYVSMLHKTVVRNTLIEYACYFIIKLTLFRKLHF